MVKLIPPVANGMQFQCKRCGKCCSSSTEGFVYIFPSDIPNLLKHTKLDPKSFGEKYIRIVNFVFHIWNANLEDTGRRVMLPTLVLNSENIADCLFLTTINHIKSCNIYEYRPFQCRAYPCWSMVLTSNEEQLQQHQADCPGFTINSQSEQQYPIQNFPQEEIISWVKKERQIERDYFLKMQEYRNDIYKMYTFLNPQLLAHQNPPEE